MISQSIKKNFFTNLFTDSFTINAQVSTTHQYSLLGWEATISNHSTWNAEVVCQEIFHVWTDTIHRCHCLPKPWGRDISVMCYIYKKTFLKHWAFPGIVRIPPVEDIHFQKLCTPGIPTKLSPFPGTPSKFLPLPGIFPFFFLPPPGIFKIQTPLEFHFPQQGGYGLFSGKAHS